MNNELNTKDTSSKYAWNDSIILDKIQEILEGKNIDELKILPEEDIKMAKPQ